VLERIDYLTLAHITVTCVMDHLGRGSVCLTPISTLFDEIGARIDHQCFLETVKRVDPRAFDSIDRWILRKSSKGYTQKILSAQSKAEDVDYTFMGVKERAALGDWCFAAFQSITLWFDTLKYFQGTGRKTTTTYFLSLSPEGLKYRDVIQASADDRAYEAWPMVCPPLPWVLNEKGKVTERGGYLKAHPGKLSTLIRGNRGSTPSQEALDALHKMQNQPFRINHFIYETCKLLLLKTEEIGRFRSFERDSWDDVHKPSIDPRVWDLPLDQDRNPHPETRKARSLLHEWHTNRKVAEKGRVAPFRCLMVAVRFLHVDKFYLPCYFDNRLRMYYMVDTLNPQGSDYQKALLLFADGNPVTPENREAVRRDLLITIANTWANKEQGVKTDKLSLQGRVSFSEAFLRELEGVAKDPLTTASKAIWTAASEPFQFLAAVREYFEIFVWKTSSVARVPNGRDATNSGSQILGAIIRDQKTCVYTNVLPTTAPMDLYGEVAREAQALLRNYGWVDRQQGKARKRAEQRMKRLQAEGADDYVINTDELVFRLDPEVVDRSVCKRASMCTAYGASWQSKNEYVSEELDDIPGAVKASLTDKIIVTNAVIEGQANAFPHMEEVNKWFKQVGRACLEAGREYVEWVTPNGSRIVQEYRERLTETVVTYAMGGAKYWQPVKSGDTKGLDRSHIRFQTGWGGVKENKTQSALGANYTHSMDACIVQKTIHDWDHPFFVVHDCFYGPAGTMEAMCQKARVAFYETTVLADPLGKLIEINNIPLEKPPMGEAKAEDCLLSQYMFS
jgi:DNA-directed RNA polymerase